MGPLKCFQFPNLDGVSGQGGVGALKQVCKVGRAGEAGVSRAPVPGRRAPSVLARPPLPPQKAVRWWLLPCVGGASPVPHLLLCRRPTHRPRLIGPVQSRNATPAAKGVAVA